MDCYNTFTEGRRVVVVMLECAKPIIAAIEGPAVGRGATIAPLCDIKVAARTAVIWLRLVGVGGARASRRSVPRPSALRSRCA